MVTIDVKPSTWERLNNMKSSPSDTFDEMVVSALDTLGQFYNGVTIKERSSE